MDNKNNNESFKYTYSAKNQEEIRKIRQKYEKKCDEKEDKMERLRRLDESVTRKGTIVALVSGIVGALILGLGMSCCMVWGGIWFVPGIFIGIVGIVLESVAYPLYNVITKKEREKIAPEIIRLTDELMQ